MNPFVQLLSGVVWLVRNGSIYINESQAIECDETQETGQERGQLECFLFYCCYVLIYLFCGGAHAIVCRGRSEDNSFSPSIV